MIQLASLNNDIKLKLESIMDSSEARALNRAVSLDSMDLVLRKYLDPGKMKEAGSYFTGQAMASATVRSFKRRITTSSVVLDPTCGAGNLLIECSRSLPVDCSLKSTLRQWGKLLRGYDIHETFIEAAKLRLIIEAISRGACKDCSLESAMGFFPNIRVVDVMLLDVKDVLDVTHVIMNPPFSSWVVSEDGFWNAGKVNAAGIVYKHVVSLLQDGTEVAAILPDVLRSGSRYERWRFFSESMMTGECEILGKFGKNTDVDVFLLSGRVALNSPSNINWRDGVCLGSVLSDFFDVCVGPLVAYRDPEIGEVYPFVHPKSIPAWSIVSNFSEERRFSGRVIEPPLVVIRRTSSPSDRYRAVGSVILGKSPVAVENHMIVVKPKDNSLERCVGLLEILKSENTNEYLNEAIRLRHLTVGSVKNIPM